MSRIVSLGEIMLRLKAPGSGLLAESPVLEASFGGSEANVAVSLANFGLDSAYVTALPENVIADAALATLGSFGVDVSGVVRSGNRMGIYFLETTADGQPSNVVYDRSGSSIAEADPAAFDWPAILTDADWLHISGITPALSASAARLSLEACRQARDHELTISCDLNFRAQLWRYGKSPPEVMAEVVALADIVVANDSNCRQSLGLTQESKPDASVEQHYRDLTTKLMQHYPNLAIAAVTIKGVTDTGTQHWSACLRSNDGFFTAPEYEITDVVDRVGSGDAFAAGLIYGLTELADATDAIAFATAAGFLKHSFSGDFSRASVTDVAAAIPAEFRPKKHPA